MSDLKEAQELYCRFPERRPSRTFLTGANPFVLEYQKLMAIAEQIHSYFPEMRSIGCFARVTDVTLKTEAELEALHRAGYDGLTIGIETADDEARCAGNSSGLQSASSDDCRCQYADRLSRFFII